MPSLFQTDGKYFFTPFQKEIIKSGLNSLKADIKIIVKSSQISNAILK